MVELPRLSNAGSIIGVVDLVKYPFSTGSLTRSTTQKRSLSQRLSGQLILLLSSKRRLMDADGDDRLFGIAGDFQPVSGIQQAAREDEDTFGSNVRDSWRHEPIREVRLYIPSYRERLRYRLDAR